MHSRSRVPRESESRVKKLLDEFSGEVFRSLRTSWQFTSEVMTSLPETSTVTMVTTAVAGPVSGKAATAGVAGGANALTTLLDTIRATVRDELHRQLPQMAVAAASSEPGVSTPGPSQPHHSMSVADAPVLEGLAGEVRVSGRMYR